MRKVNFEMFDIHENIWNNTFYERITPFHIFFSNINNQII